MQGKMSCLWLAILIAYTGGCLCGGAVASGAVESGADVSAAGADLPPGLHRNLPAAGPLITTRYHLFLPTIHSNSPAERLPMVLFASIGGEADLSFFQTWAEEQGVILVSLVRQETSEQQVLQPIVDAVLTTVMASYHIDPALRFSFATLSSVTSLLSTTPGYEWAGFVGCGFFPSQKPLQTKACIGWVMWPISDDRQSLAGSAQNALERMRSWGNPVRVSPAPEVSEHWRADPQALHMLDWMLVWQRLLRTAPAEKIKTMSWIRARLTALQTDTDHPHRLAQAETFLLVPQVTIMPEAKILPGIWADEMIFSIQSEPNAMQRARHWEDLKQHMWVQNLSAAQKRTVTKEIETLRKDPDIRVDSDSRAAFHAIELKLIDYDRGLTKGDWQKALRGLIVEMETISTRWPGSQAAERAKKRILLCEKDLH